MPRANRCILPGYIYHLTHRCHDRDFLLRFALDRTEYCARLRDAVRRHPVQLFGYCVTCNHVHLLAASKTPSGLSRFMQQLEGGFASYFNLRKNRSGAFWGDRYHCTMIEGGEHLWNCLRYIDLNMVRAGVVGHPEEWRWCGYGELTGVRQRYCLLDVEGLVEFLGTGDRKSLAEMHSRRIAEAIAGGQLVREAVWSGSVAVGTEVFIRAVAAKSRRRKRLRLGRCDNGSWFVREEVVAYAGG